MPVLVQLFPARISGYLDVSVGYFKSEWNEIRSNAAMVAANIMASGRPPARLCRAVQWRLGARMLEPGSGCTSVTSHPVRDCCCCCGLVHFDVVQR